ncbi:hypothetical protein ES703_116822 [subsurface metagenome]
MENEGKIEVEKEKENPCASITSMEKWVEEGDEAECRPCLLPPVIRWYRDHLQQSGLNELAHEMETAIEGADPLIIAKTFDSIKAKVPDDVKKRLEEFDCAAQLYKEIEETKTNGQ